MQIKKLSNNHEKQLLDKNSATKKHAALQDYLKKIGHYLNLAQLTNYK